MTLFALVGLAQAQTVVAGDVPALNAQLFRPSIDSGRLLWTDESQAGPDNYLSGRFALHYANDPLVYITRKGERVELVSGIYQLDLMAAYTRGPVRLGVDLPVYLRSIGSVGGETGLGDVALDLRATVLDRDEGPVGLAASARLGFPTSTVQAPLGADGFGYELGLIADKEFGPVLLAANIGTIGRPDVSLENVDWGDQFYGRLGAGIGDDNAGASLELATFLTYGEFSNPSARPSEAMAGGYYRVAGNWLLRGGVGTGISTGIGAPRVRVVAAVAWEPPRESDRDGDGVGDAQDACVDVPEDLDRVQDGDGCPEPTALVVEVVDPDGTPIPTASWTLSGPGEASGTHGSSAELFGGHYTLSGQAEGFAPSSLEVDVPDAESWTGRVTLGWIPGSLTISAVDEAGNDVSHATWKLMNTPYADLPVGKTQELPPGTYSLRVDADGYRPVHQKITVVSEGEETVVLTLLPSKAKVTKERIDISDSVYFETDKAIIKPESYSLLDDVAAILTTHPELTKVRIEGHTDSRGSDDHNLDLSQRRAEAVRQYLIEKGVEAERLEAVGYGETKPLDPAENAAAWEKNRRVDFFVTERSDEE